MHINEEQTEFYSQIGRAITQWTHVEDALFSNFLKAISNKRSFNIPAQAAFYAIQSPEGKISMAKSAVMFRLLQGMGDQPNDQRRQMLALWLNLCVRANKRRYRRNLLAHFQTLTNTEATPGKRFQLRPPLFNPNVMLGPMKSWHCAELAATTRSFGKLAMDLGAFSDGLAFLLGQTQELGVRADHLALLLRQLEGRSYEGRGLPQPPFQE